MFIGEYQHSLDQKDRLAVPVKFRAKLKEGAVVTRGLDNCLFLYPKSEWKKLADKLATLPISKSNTRAFSRFMLSGAMDADVDKQGRIKIPDYLKKFAGLKKNVVVAGLLNRLELWDKEVWNKYKLTTEKASVNIAEELENLDV
ncbi:MAG TPA: division/cell wall cluster transcriptional repressor MraZ [Candidatus Bipolaricaulota bacterium]|nr:division/cell wall cluster transcriptional repressor MraZ [Candidatus Bipolaricaulota bacterium]